MMRYFWMNSESLPLNAFKPPNTLAQYIYRHCIFLLNCNWFELKLQMSNHPLLRRYYRVTNAVYDTTLNGKHKAESKAVLSFCIITAVIIFWRERQHKPASISIQSLPVPPLPPLLVALYGQSDTQNCLNFKRRLHEIYTMCPRPTSHAYILK